MDVVEHQVALREGAALRVLAGQPHGDAVDEQRRVGQRLRLPPVDAALADCDAAPLELPSELRMHGELVRRSEQLLGQRDEPVLRNSGHDLRPRRAGDRAVVLARSRRFAERRFQAVVGGAQHRLDLCHERIRVLAGQHAFRDQPLLVELTDTRVRVDLLDHQRLRVRSLVLLVVAEAPVPTGSITTSCANRRR